MECLNCGRDAVEDFCEYCLGIISANNLGTEFPPEVLAILDDNVGVILTDTLENEEWFSLREGNDNDPTTN